jgi:hypothetical protein
MRCGEDAAPLLQPYNRATQFPDGADTVFSNVVMRRMADGGYNSKGKTKVVAEACRELLLSLEGTEQQKAALHEAIDRPSTEGDRPSSEGDEVRFQELRQQVVETHEQICASGGECWWSPKMGGILIVKSSG